MKKLIFGAWLFLYTAFAFAGLTVPSYNGAPYFQAHLSGNATPAVNTATRINAGVKDFDSGNYYDAATNFRYQPLVAGKYLVHAKMTFNPTNSAGVMLADLVMIYKNGSLLYSERQDLYNSGTSLIHNVDAVAIVPMNGSTDYVEMWGQCSIGSACTILGGSGLSLFEAYYLGP